MGHNVDVQFFKPFIDGTLATLRVQCNHAAKVGKPFMRDQGGGENLIIDIAGIIGITSKSFTGSISLCFPEKTFLGLMSGMLGEKFEKLTKDLEDGAGELTNIIFGSAKRVLNDNGHTLEKALPSVVVGSGVRVRTVTPIPTLVLPFMTDSGPFQMEIGIELTENKN